MTRGDFDLAAVALAAAVAFLAMQEPPGEPAELEDGSLSSPPWPMPDDIGLPMPITLPFPGGHPEWDNQILYACNLYGMTDALAPLMVKAIIEHESAHTWNPRIPGDRGPCPAYRGDAAYVGFCSIGLMQVHRPSHPDLADAYDLRDGNQNILAGCQVLAGAYHRYWPDWESVLETYNQGSPYRAGTTNYAANVGGTFRRLAAEAGIAV